MRSRRHQDLAHSVAAHMRLRFRTRNLLIVMALFALCLAVWPALWKHWAVYSVVRHLDDSGTKVRDASVALTDWGDGSVPALVELLKHDDFYVRIVAADSLRKLGPEARSAVEDLTRALSDKNHRVRYAAAKALGAIGPDAKTTVPDLIVALGDSEPSVQFAAVEALRRLGIHAEGALPELQVLATNKHSAVHNFARDAVFIITLSLAIKGGNLESVRPYFTTAGLPGDVGVSADELEELLTHNKSEDFNYYFSEDPHRSKVLFECPVQGKQASEVANVFVIGERIGEGSIGVPPPWRIVRVTTDPAEAESLVGPRVPGIPFR